MRNQFKELMIRLRAKPPRLPRNRPEWARDDVEPVLERVVSQLCTREQFDSPIYAKWVEAMAERPRTHRKQWEFVFILEALHQAGKLRSGMSGLGFGVGKEPLPAVMAKRGVSVLATDLAATDAAAAGWASTNQHASVLEDLNERGICAPDAFKNLVTFREQDMNRLDDDLRNFDFCWSSCAFEHLGSIDAGLAFVRNSIRTLKSGGIAVHTTEYNCSSDDDTVSQGGTVIFRMRDMLELGRVLRSEGHYIEFNFNRGQHRVDRYVDMAPYSEDIHLKLLLMKYTSTSIGLVIHKDGLTIR